MVLQSPVKEPKILPGSLPGHLCPLLHAIVTEAAVVDLRFGRGVGSWVKVEGGLQRQRLRVYLGSIEWLN